MKNEMSINDLKNKLNESLCSLSTTAGQVTASARQVTDILIQTINKLSEENKSLKKEVETLTEQLAFNNKPKLRGKK